MTREELIEHLKANNGIALDEISEDNIRKLAVFHDGFYCGYIGVPQDHPLYKDISSFRKAEDIIGYICHGGITYAEKSEPSPSEFDEKRLWLGFDCNHSCDGRDYDLMKAVYGKERADHCRMLFFYQNDKEPVSLNEVRRDIEVLEKFAKEYTINKREKYAVTNVTVSEISLLDKNAYCPSKLFIPFDKIEDVNGVISEDKIKTIIEERYGPCECFDIDIVVKIPDNDGYQDYTIPVDDLYTFYHEQILTDDDYRDGNDISMTKWLREEYVPDDLKMLPDWYENQKECIEEER